MGGIDDARIDFPGQSSPGPTLRHMHLSRPVTALTTYRQFGEWRLAIKPRLFVNGLWTSGVAAQTLCDHRPCKGQVALLVTGRKAPGARLRVVRERGLKQVAFALHQKAKAILSRPDDETHFPGLAEKFFAVLTHRVLALIVAPVFSRDFKVLSRIAVEQSERNRKAAPHGSIIFIHAWSAPWRFSNIWRICRGDTPRRLANPRSSCTKRSPGQQAQD